MALIRLAQSGKVKFDAILTAVLFVVTVSMIAMASVYSNRDLYSGAIAMAILTVGFLMACTFTTGFSALRRDSA